MRPTVRLNLMLFVGIVLIAGVNVAMFSYSFWGPSFNQYWSEFWKAHTLKPAVKAGDRMASECLGVSDFYSAHLTTYFLADSAESAGGPTDDMSKYDEYCDRVPGTGKVIFSVTLMEKEARNESVALSFYEDAGGGLKQLAALPSSPHPSGYVDIGRNGRPQGKISPQACVRRGEEQGGHDRDADLRRAVTSRPAAMVVARPASRMRCFFFKPGAYARDACAATAIKPVDVKGSRVSGRSEERTDGRFRQRPRRYAAEIAIPETFRLR